MPGFTPYVNVVGRYSQLSTLLKGNSDEVTSHFILPAESELESRLSGHFTTPFSSTNVTAQDLVVDMVRIRAGIGKEKDLEPIRKSIEERIMRLISGEQGMMVSSSNGFYASVLSTVSGTVWSDTQDYHPTFGHGEVEDFVVSSAMLEAEEDDRGIF